MLAASAFESSGSIATTRASGFSPFTAVAMPETSPPPPTWTSTTSASGTSSSISTPTVPWPAITSGSSYGCTSVRPVSSTSRSRCSNAAGMSGGESSTVAPYARAAAIFIGRRRLPHHDERVDALDGGRVRERLRVVAGGDGDHAARLLLVVSVESLFRTPRGLNAPVRWRSSALKCTGTPTCSESVREQSIGVRCSRPAIRSRARIDVVERQQLPKSWPHGDPRHVWRQPLRRIVTSVCRKCDLETFEMPALSYRADGGVRPAHRGALRLLPRRDAWQQPAFDLRGRSRPRAVPPHRSDAAARRYGWVFYAYCLMGQPLPPRIVQIGSERGISRGMCELNTGYAATFNVRHGRMNHLFGRRFWSELITTDEYPPRRVQVRASRTRSEPACASDAKTGSGVAIGRPSASSHRRHSCALVPRSPGSQPRRRTRSIRSGEYCSQHRPEADAVLAEHAVWRQPPSRSAVDEISTRGASVCALVTSRAARGLDVRRNVGGLTLRTFR